MNKKWLLGLGTIAAIAAPVVGLVSCKKEETIAEKEVSVYPNEIKVKVGNKDFDFLKSMTTDGANIKNFSDISDGIDNLKDEDLIKWGKELKKDTAIKNFNTKVTKQTAKMEKTAKVIKGFANNKITIEIKILAGEIKPDIINRGTATKTIDITFLAS